MGTSQYKLNICEKFDEFKIAPISFFMEKQIENDGGYPKLHENVMDDMGEGIKRLQIPHAQSILMQIGDRDDNNGFSTSFSPYRGLQSGWMNWTGEDAMPFLLKILENFKGSNRDEKLTIWLEAMFSPHDTRKIHKFMEIGQDEYMNWLDEFRKVTPTGQDVDRHLLKVILKSVMIQLLAMGY